jgi:hypothetical protein
MVECTLIDDDSIWSLLEERVEPPVQAGFHAIRLADHNVRLVKDKKYKWFVALVPDPDHRSRDIIAGGAIERIELPEGLEKKLGQTTKPTAPHVYAENGIWYEAVSSVSELIESNPHDKVLREKRAALFEQVGLSEIAAYDKCP